MQQTDVHTRTEIRSAGNNWPRARREKPRAQTANEWRTHGRVYTPVRVCSQRGSPPVWARTAAATAAAERLLSLCVSVLGRVHS